MLCRGPRTYYTSERGIGGTQFLRFLFHRTALFDSGFAYLADSPLPSSLQPSASHAFHARPATMHLRDAETIGAKRTILMIFLAQHEGKSLVSNEGDAFCPGVPFCPERSLSLSLSLSYATCEMTLRALCWTRAWRTLYRPVTVSDSLGTREETKIGNKEKNKGAGYLGPASPTRRPVAK